MWGEKVDRTEQREKRTHNAVSTKASANPTRCSGVGLENVPLYPCISQSLEKEVALDKEVPWG